MDGAERTEATRLLRKPAQVSNVLSSRRLEQYVLASLSRHSNLPEI